MSDCIIPAFQPAFPPPGNPDFYGGDRLDLLFGVNLVGQRGAICGDRIAAEFGFPVHQDLNGPPLETDYTFTLGWQKALGDCLGRKANVAAGL